MSREAMQMALEALELYQSKSSVQMFDDAVKALRQALETEQEPVYAFRRKGLDDFCTCDKRRYDELSGKPNLFEVTVFYTAPPKQWVGLTDEDRKSFYKNAYAISDDELIERVEAKLKQKNGVEYRNGATTERTKLNQENT